MTPDITRVSILGSALHNMKATATGRHYRITVSLPLGYDKSPEEGWPFNNSPTQWPVVYVLDGNWYFGMVTDIVRPMAWCGSTTDAIIVGIGYPEAEEPIEAFRTSFTRRNLDLTPVQDEAEDKAMEAQHHRPTPSGDAAGFHAFITQDLIPFIEQTYKANPQKRILAGHSYGGLFAAYTMFKTPEIFNTLIIGSPTLSYGSRYTFAQEEAFATENTRLPATVYLYVADGEESLNDTTLTETLRFAAILESRRYEEFSLVKRVFRDQGHCSVAAPGIQAGLKMALRR